jgi:hypothetical protein
MEPESRRKGRQVKVTDEALSNGTRGTGYRVTPHESGSLSIKHGSLAFATVHLVRDGDATTFRVHGGGLIVGRIVNELGIARTVTAAIKESFEPAGR